MLEILWNNKYPIIKAKYGETKVQDVIASQVNGEKEKSSSCFARNKIISKNSWDSKQNYFSSSEPLNKSKNSASASKLKTEQNDTRREDKFIDVSNEIPNQTVQGFGSLVTNKILIQELSTKVTTENQNSFNESFKLKIGKAFLIND